MKYIALYSEVDDVDPDQQLSPAEIEAVVEKEIVSVCQDKSYMGILEMSAAAHLLNAEICSVFPELGWDVGVQLNNRRIQPSPCPGSIWHIMWSSSRTDMNAQNWVANHFSPLMRLAPEETGSLSGEHERMEGDENDQILEGDYFLTTFNGRQYVARILKHFPKEKLVKLQYMCEKAPSGSGLWYWLAQDDTGHEDTANLLRKVKLVMDERISNQRMQYYKSY